jgi:hypothetical protein
MVDDVPPRHLTPAPAHSNSICSYSGLNDLIVGQRPIDPAALPRLVPPVTPGRDANRSARASAEGAAPQLPLPERLRQLITARCAPRRRVRGESRDRLSGGLGRSLRSI